MTRFATGLLLCWMIFSGGSAAAGGEMVKIRQDALLLNGNLELPDGAALGDRVVLLLHGTLAHHEMEIMQSLQELLAERGIASLAVSLSFGISDRKGMFDCSLPHRHTEKQAAVEIETWLAWLAKEGVRQVVLAGHSRGGAQMARFAARGSSPMVTQVVLIAPTTGDEERLARDYAAAHGLPLALVVERARNLVAESHEGELMPDIGFLSCRKASVQAATFLDYYDGKDRPDLASSIQAIKVPVLVVAAGNDEIVPDVAARLAPLAAGGRLTLVKVEDADHFFRDLYAEDAADAIAAFIGR